MHTTMTTGLKKLFDRSEVAQRLGVSTRYLDRKIAEGKIDVVRFGVRVKIHADEVERVERQGLK
ncbi:helix-turn-helix transcriptional regulator [Aeoliella sp.]|uniref:helix-turn-helix transcriptional regulator n=1 Tax=Aeoliella sp. TaxID=2795800 RepID=UPI003CCC0EC3